MYLVEGKDKALLFDTGMGTGDLAGFIKTLTNLPVDVAITHGNRDHFQQVDLFRESTVYMSKKDITRLPPQFITPGFKWVENGDVIDIGAGRRFQVLEVPGHSLGCLVFLDVVNKMAVVGDGVGSGDRVHMFGAACTALDQYLDGLKKVEERIKNLDGLTLLVGHHYQEKTPLTGVAGKQLFTDMRNLSEKVLSGEITGKVAYTTRDGVTSEFRQVYFGLAGLWYNPKNLVTHPAALGDLGIQTSEGKALITKPIFSSFQTNYTANVQGDAKSICMTPIAYYSDYKSLTINGKAVRSNVVYKAKLESGSNKFDIAVTGQHGATRNYTVTITK
jgi:glyoxylase-like metal-dependent hydrolase (beta-lactamase superfamily II)